MPRREDPSTYFSPLTGLYASHRPTYPEAAFRAALNGLGDAPVVVDIGCGTGIASRALAGLGMRVIALDPNEAMLEAARSHPDAMMREIDYRLASAEKTGLPGDSADLILCAQAFHWFDAPVALAEFHRVLRRRGRLALLWNVRLPDHDPLTRGYEEVVRRAQADAKQRGRVAGHRYAFDPESTTRFRVTGRLAFRNPQRLDREGFIGRARSASYFPPDGPLRDELTAELHRLFDEHESDGEVALAQEARLTLTSPPAPSSPTG